MIIEYRAPEGSSMRYTWQPLLFDGHASGVLRRAPALGEHNEELLPGNHGHTN